MNTIPEKPGGLSSPRIADLRRLSAWTFAILIAASAIAVRIMPVMDATVRGILAAMLLSGLFTAFLFLLKLFSARPRALYPAIFIIGLFITWAVLANKPPDTASLRVVYKSRLRAFLGTRFSWGGETTGGIDCSGLARAAFWQAILFEGFEDLNPRLLGPNLWRFWWRDMSAEAILEGEYGYTHVVGKADKLAGHDNFWLQVGDMAVTSDGMHVLIYYGHGRWIEANPEDHRVVVNKATAGSKRPYFNTRVTFVRWWLFHE